MSSFLSRIHRAFPSALADGGAATRNLRGALVALVVAIAAFVSAIVVILIPQPVPYLAQAPLACKVTRAHQSPDVAKARPVSRLSRSSDDIPTSSCA
jgi:hypothetical protein